MASINWEYCDQSIGIKYIFVNVKVLAQLISKLIERLQMAAAGALHLQSILLA
jgi:hypothetical protein